MLWFFQLIFIKYGIKFTQNIVCKRKSGGSVLNESISIMKFIERSFRILWTLRLNRSCCCLDHRLSLTTYTKHIFHSRSGQLLFLLLSLTLIGFCSFQLLTHFFDFFFTRLLTWVTHQSALLGGLLIVLILDFVSLLSNTLRSFY